MLHFLKSILVLLYFVSTYQSFCRRGTQQKYIWIVHISTKIPTRQLFCFFKNFRFTATWLYLPTKYVVIFSRTSKFIEYYLNTWCKSLALVVSSCLRGTTYFVYLCIMYIIINMLCKFITVECSDVQNIFLIHLNSYNLDYPHSATSKKKLYIIILILFKVITQN